MSQMISLNKIVTSLESGSRPAGGIKANTIGIPSIGAEHLNEQGKFNFNNVKYIPDSFFESQKKGIIKANDILIVKDGATTGKASFVDESFPFAVASLNEHVFRLAVDEKIALPKYIFWYLFSGYGKMQIMSNFRGSTIGGITKDFVNGVKLNLPSLEKQHRIVKILDLAQSLIEKRKQAIAYLDDYIKAVFLDMFGDPVSNPKGWEKNVFSDLCYRLSDGPFGSKLKTEHYSNAGMRVIRLQNIGIGKFKDENKSFIKNTHYERELVNYTCHAGDIVIATLGEPSIRACKIPEDIKKAVNKADCIHCIPVEMLNKDYLISLLNLSEFHSIFANYIHGQTRSRVSVGQLKNIMIPVPPLELQRKFSAIVEKSELIREQMQSQLKELEDNFQAQLQRAFRGE